MTEAGAKILAKAIATAFTVSDEIAPTREPANLADAIILAGQEIGKKLRELGTGDAATPMGAIELLAKEVRDGSVEISNALRDVAEAIREHSA